MLKTQRLLLILLSVILLGTVTDALSQNWTEHMAFFHLFTWTFPGLSIGLILLLIVLASGAGVFCLMQERLLRLDTQQKKVNRALERQDVSRETAEEKVKVLEQKIETLEHALRNALKSDSK